MHLSLGYYVNAAGTWGTGVTCAISRDAVEFAPAERSLNVGDVLHYVLAFPGSAGSTGAVALCRGRVVRAGAVVVVTIDEYRLQTATAARAERRNARTDWLVGLCEAARLGSHPGAMTAAGRGLSASRPA
jgi:hypothetical protein